MTLSPPPCESASGQIPATAALSNPVLYRPTDRCVVNAILAILRTNATNHFFDTFGKLAAQHSTDDCRSSVARRERTILYLELMLTPDRVHEPYRASKLGWDETLKERSYKLRTDIDSAARAGVKALVEAERRRNTFLKCGTPEADSGSAR